MLGHARMLAHHGCDLAHTPQPRGPSRVQTGADLGVADKEGTFVQTFAP